MKNILLPTTATLLCMYCATVAQAQQSQSTATVPKLVRFSGTFRPATRGYLNNDLSIRRYRRPLSRRFPHFDNKRELLRNEWGLWG